VKTLDERKAGTTCSRCGEQRWPFKTWQEPHTCQRCCEVLAGGNARDPLGTDAQHAAAAVARAARNKELGGEIATKIERPTPDMSAV